MEKQNGLQSITRCGRNFEKNRFECISIHEKGTFKTMIGVIAGHFMTKKMAVM